MKLFIYPRVNKLTSKQVNERREALQVGASLSSAHQLVYSFTCLLVYLFTACEIDNYEPPTGGLYGQIVDAETGDPVPQPLPSEGGLRLRFYEADRENAIEQHFYAQADGSYKNTHLFNGPVRLVLEQRNFFPIDTVELNIQGQTKKDIEVIPYARIKVKSLQADGNLITAGFTIERSKNRSYERLHLSQYLLLWHASPYIDRQTVNFSGQISTGFPDEPDALNRLHDVALDLSDDTNRKLLKEKANIISGNGNIIYIRLCLITYDESSDAIYANYSSTYPIKIAL
ncbi:MAG: DUF3823 domain-containing protein [Dysgonamonadaceae bacterium]|jgi:hypothetical protein|nr:DUF3823 domain-containing protein [Dysgonamonadaceae bacterium]